MIHVVLVLPKFKFPWRLIRRSLAPALYDTLEQNFKQVQFNLRAQLYLIVFHNS